MADRDEKRRTNENWKQTKRPGEVRELEKVKTISICSAERKWSYWELEKN